MKLFVLGPTQSGKTCLAIGLSGTSYGKTLFRRAFVSNARGDASRNHFKSLQKELAGAHWPAGTTETKTLDFGFQWRGRTVDFSFNDYMGEKSTDPSFLKKLTNLGSNDGVVLLVNPGFTFPCVRESDGHVRFAKPDEVANKEKPDGYFIAPAFEDSPLAREWLVEQNSIYEQLIESLKTKVGETKNAKPVVAVTVTASDRLEKKGDLRSVRPFFEDFLAKITALLDTTGFKWKRFDVTVTGALADQSKPKLASGFANTSPKPFLWILWQLWWRSHQSVLKWAGICAAVVGVLAGLGIGGYEWIESEKDFKTIVTAGSGCSEALRKEPFDKSALEKANKHLESLKQHKGFYSDRAGKSFAELESGVSEKQKELIKRKIRDVNSLYGKWDDKTDKDSPIDEIDSIFSTFVPVSTNLLTGYEDFKNNWNSVTKPKLEEEHDEYVFREKVEMPMRDCENEHGVAVMDKLYPLADFINGRHPKTNRLLDVRTNLAERLDARVANEWRDFAIRDFKAAASTNATREATRAFVARLENWTTVTANGAAAKAELYAEVTNAVPGWRTSYERATFAEQTEAAIKSDELEELAAFYPARVAARGETNDFLSLEYVTGQWTGRVQSVYEEAHTKYGTDFVKSVMARDGRPSLTDNDKNAIAETAAKVGVPFDGTKALAAIQAGVDARAKEWDDARENECKAWVEKNIKRRPDRPRTGTDGLWDTYRQDSRRMFAENPSFAKIVAPAVYHEVEKWLEADVETFRKELCPLSGLSIWSDDENVAVRFRGLDETFQRFRTICRRILEDSNPPAGTWAHRFAELCRDKGRIDDGINRAFPQRIVATKLDAKIDYHGRFPTNYKFTSFAAWFEVVTFGPDGQPEGETRFEDLIDCDRDGDAPNDNHSTQITHENQWKTVWTGNKVCEAGLFQRTRFVVRTTDYNSWINATAKTEDIVLFPIPFATKSPISILPGQLHLRDLGRSDGAEVVDVSVALSATMSGATPFTLLEQAKQEMSKGGK